MKDAEWVAAADDEEEGGGSLLSSGSSGLGGAGDSGEGGEAEVILEMALAVRLSDEALVMTETREADVDGVAVPEEPFSIPYGARSRFSDFKNDLDGVTGSPFTTAVIGVSAIMRSKHLFASN